MKHLNNQDITLIQSIAALISEELTKIDQTITTQELYYRYDPDPKSTKTAILVINAKNQTYELTVSLETTLHERYTYRAVHTPKSGVRTERQYYVSEDLNQPGLNLRIGYDEDTQQWHIFHTILAPHDEKGYCFTKAAELINAMIKNKIKLKRLY